MRTPTRAAAPHGPQPPSLTAKSSSSPAKKGKGVSTPTFPHTTPSSTKSKAVKNVPSSCREDSPLKFSQSRSPSSNSPRRRSTSSGNSSRGRSSSFNARPSDEALPSSTLTPSKSNKRPLSKATKLPSPSLKKGKTKVAASSPSQKRSSSPAKKKAKLSYGKSPKKGDSTSKYPVTIKTEVEDPPDELSEEEQEFMFSSPIKQEVQDHGLYYEHVAQSIENVINMSFEKLNAQIRTPTKDKEKAKKPKRVSSSAKKAENIIKVEKPPQKKRGRPKGSKNKKKADDTKKTVKVAKKKGAESRFTQDSTTDTKSSNKIKSENLMQNHDTFKIAAGIDSTNSSKTSSKKTSEETGPHHGIAGKKKANSKLAKDASDKMTKKKVSVISSKAKSKTPIKKLPKHLASLPVKKRIKTKKEEEERYPSKPHSKAGKGRKKATEKRKDDFEEEKKTKKFKKEADFDLKKGSKCPPKKRGYATKHTSKEVHHSSSEDEDEYQEEEEDSEASKQPLKKAIKEKWQKEELSKQRKEKKAMIKKSNMSSILPKKRRVVFMPERRSSPKYYVEDSDLTDSEDELLFNHFKADTKKKPKKKKEPPPPKEVPVKRKARMASLNARAMMHCMNEDAKIPLPSLPPAHSKDDSMALVVRESTIARAHSDDSSSETEDEISGRTSKNSRKEEEEKSKKKNNQKRKRRRGELDVQMDMRDMVVTKRMALLNASAIMAASYSMESRSRKVPPAASSSSSSGSAESEVTNVDIKRKISYKSTKDQTNKTRSVITVQETTKKVKKAQGSSQTEVEERIIVKKRVKRQAGDLEVEDAARKDDGNVTDTSEIDQEMIPKSPDGGMIVESTITYVTTHTHTVPKTVSVSEDSKCTISSTNEKSTTVVQQVQRKSITSSSAAPMTLPSSSHLQQGQIPPSSGLISHASPTPQNYSPLGALSGMQPVMHTPPPPPHPPYPHPPPHPHHHLPHHMPPIPSYPHIPGQPPPLQNMGSHHHFHPIPHPSLTPAYPLTPHSPPYPPPRSSSAGSSPACSSSPSSTPRPISSPSPHPSLASSGYGTSPNGSGSKGSTTSPPVYPSQQQRPLPSSGKHPSVYPDERSYPHQMSPSKHPLPSGVLAHPPPGERHHSAFTTPTPSANSPANALPHGYQPVSGPMPIPGPNTSPNYKPQLSPSISQSPYSSPPRMTSPSPQPTGNKASIPPPPSKPEQYSPSLPHPAAPQSFQGYTYPPPYEKYYPRGHPYNLYQHGYPGGGYSSQGSSEYPYPQHHPPPPGSHGGSLGTTGTHYSQENYNSRNLCPPARPPSYGSPQASPPHHQPLALPPPPSSGGSPHHHTLANPNYPFADYGPVLMYPSTGTIIRINLIGPPPPHHSHPPHHHPSAPPPSICCPSNSKNVQRGPLTGTGKGSSEREGDPGDNAGVPSTSSNNYHCYGGCPPSPNVSTCQVPHPSMQPPPAAVGQISAREPPHITRWQDSKQSSEKSSPQKHPSSVSQNCNNAAAISDRNRLLSSVSQDSKKNNKLKEVINKEKDAKESSDNEACTSISYAKETTHLKSTSHEPRPPTSVCSFDKTVMSSKVSSSTGMLNNAKASNSVHVLPSVQSNEYSFKGNYSQALHQESGKPQPFSSLPSPVCSLLPSSSSVSVSTIGVIPKKTTVPSTCINLPTSSSVSISPSSSDKSNFKNKPPLKTLNDGSKASVASSSAPSLNLSVPIECASKSITITSSKNNCRKNEKSATLSSSVSPSSPGEQVITTFSACVSAVTVPNFPTLPRNSRTPQTTWVVQPSASLSSVPPCSEQSPTNGLSTDVPQSTKAAAATSSIQATSTTTTLSSSSAGMHSVSTSTMLTKEKQVFSKSDVLAPTPSIKDSAKLIQNGKEKSKIEAQIENLRKKAGPLNNYEEKRPTSRHLMCHCVPQIKNYEVVPKVSKNSLVPLGNKTTLESSRKAFSSDTNLSLPSGDNTQNDKVTQIKREVSSDSKDIDSSSRQPRKRGRPPKNKDHMEKNNELNIVQIDSNDLDDPLHILDGNAVIKDKKVLGKVQPGKKPSTLPSKNSPSADSINEPHSTKNTKLCNPDSTQVRKDLDQKDDNLNPETADWNNCDSNGERILPVQKSASLSPPEESPSSMSLKHEEEPKNIDSPALNHVKYKERFAKLKNSDQFFRDPPEEFPSESLSKDIGTPLCDETTTSHPINNIAPPAKELKMLNIKTEIADKIKIEKISPKQNLSSSGNPPLTEIQKMKFLNGDSDLSFKDLLIPSTDKDSNSAFLEKFLKDEDTSLGLYEKKAGLLFSDKWEKEKITPPPLYSQQSFTKFEPPKSRSSKSPPQSLRMHKAPRGEKKKKSHTGKVRKSASLLASLKDRNTESESPSLDIESQQPFPVTEEIKKCKKKEDPKKKKSPFSAYNFMTSPRRRRSSGPLKGKTLKKPKYIHGWSWDGDSFEGKVWLRNDEPITTRKCYKAMKHKEGDRIRVRDCVLLKSGPRKSDLPYVAKVAALWEDPETSDMMMSILWYYRPEHTDAGRREEDLADEIFASKHRDHLSVACIEDRCYVLTFNEYCRYRRLLRLFQEGTNSPSSHSPVPDTEDGYIRKDRQPQGCVVPEILFFCRKVYDYRQKRILKNPPC